jgi:hypothetical protein
MKTITEYRPLVFSFLSTPSEESTRRRRVRSTELLAVAGYVVLGFWLSFDTGVAPWQWQFWLMFVPLFAAAELAWRTLAPSPNRRTEN